MTDDVLLWAFEHMYHMDRANACMHCAPVKFSPITFRLANRLEADWSEDEIYSPELAEVLTARGKYALDVGR